MKVVHICISAPYIDGWGYQENLLPQYMAASGVECSVIAPSDNLPSYLEADEKRRIQERGARYRVRDVDVVRIPTMRLSTSLLFPSGLMAEMERIKPDAVFHHNVNCSSLITAARYARRHGIPLLLDNHADVINMSSNRLWVFLYYKVLLRLVCRLVNPQLRKAYGVTRARCSFLIGYYGVDDAKVEFLPIGCDSELAATVGTKSELRVKYGFGEGDEIVVCGGKLGRDKGTPELVEAVCSLRRTHPDAKLILFGRLEEDCAIPDESWIRLYGWCDRMTTLELLKLSDVACWPVHHTTLIEDAISVHTPLVLRKTDTTGHLVSGNGFWLDELSSEDIADKLNAVLDRDSMDAIREACIEKCNELDYKNISKTVIEEVNGSDK